MKTAQEVRAGNVIMVGKDPMVVLKAEYNKGGRNAATMKMKMKNLLNGTEIATIFLDNDLCIRRFTSQASRIVNLAVSDVGRPISHFTTAMQKDITSISAEVGHEVGEQEQVACTGRDRERVHVHVRVGAERARDHRARTCRHPHLRHRRRALRWHTGAHRLPGA